MAADKKSRPSLEHLIEQENPGLEILHPGGKKITLDLAERCRIGKSTSVLEKAGLLDVSVQDKSVMIPWWL